MRDAALPRVCVDGWLTCVGPDGVDRVSFPCSDLALHALPWGWNLVCEHRINSAAAALIAQRDEPSLKHPARGPTVPIQDQQRRGDGWRT